MMSLSADGPTGAPSAPADTVCGSAGPPADVSRSSVARCARDSVCPPLQAKPILTPPMFTFQRINAPVKRRSEEELNGTGMNKRARSLTCPSLLSWPRKVSPRAKVKNTQPRPSTPPEPKHWRAYNMPHLSRVSGDTAEDLSRVTVSLPSSDSPMEQQTPPKTSRTLSQTTVDVAGSIQFVFGENMSERVLSPQKSPCGEEMSGTDCSSNDSDSSSSEASNTMTVQSTLWESAAAYTNACRRRCLPKQVKVFTGEENESNVVQLTCKLFVLERGSHSWRERGRGILRLNDLKRGARGCLQSRMVMRHEGNLKVILNTKLYAHTHLRRPTRCNLQLTATDVESRGVRVFLIQASARDVARLYVAVHHRLVALRCSSASVALGDGDTETALADRDGPCSNEEEEDDEEEEAEEDAIFITHVRSGDCNWRHSHSRLRP
ncbi:ran-binding protein 3-like isoform X6 [Electrophorus electricus]|uniref:ran-binding protein 3-like isoform X6 n=1 Tax=Electrophorus electricus TaxID=8005 RepID=UPI0015D0C0F3|nr:ran-binding protein 3-like isoform X6 [Electrophorus electricus]